MAPRAFVSFEMEDRWARDFLSQHARDRNIPFDFVDYSVKEPFESQWKTNVRERMARTRGTIVLIGATTWASNAVLWEIEETKRQGHPMFGVQTRSEQTFRVPIGLSPSSVTRWNFDAIRRELESW
jgi:hypothetical protein